MKTVGLQKRVISGLFFFLAVTGMVGNAFSDHDDHRYEKNEKKHAEHGGKHSLPLVNSPIFREHCGACHFSYQPGLLPSGSWKKILHGLSDHFGEEIMLEKGTKNIIAEYLGQNAADRSKSRISVKIMKSLNGETPLRITEIPYIQRKHHEISQIVFERESVGSRANCSACHKTAEDGNYDDDYVSIPK